MCGHELGPFQNVEGVSNSIQIEYKRRKDKSGFSPSKYFLITDIAGEVTRRRLPVRVAQALMAGGMAKW